MARSRRKQRRRRIVGGESTDRTMHLSRHDLAQLDEAYLAGLPEGSLRTLSVTLLLDLKELFERLEQNQDPSISHRSEVLIACSKAPSVPRQDLLNAFPIPKSRDSKANALTNRDRCLPPKLPRPLWILNHAVHRLRSLIDVRIRPVLTFPKRIIARLQIDQLEVDENRIVWGHKVQVARVSGSDNRPAQEHSFSQPPAESFRSVQRNVAITDPDEVAHLRIAHRSVNDDRLLPR
jgi:hypothetical protein